MARVDPKAGILIGDPRLVDDTYLEVNDASATGSDYTQADSVPGRVTYVDGQSWVPVISGGQGTETITVNVRGSGYVGNARCTYNLNSGTEIGWLGIRACEWLPVEWSTSSYSLHTAVVLPRNQKLVAIYAIHNSGNASCRTKTLGSSWGNAVTVASGATHLGLAAFVVPRPDESTDRIVLISVSATTQQIRTYYSDDEGATWSVLATGPEIGQTIPTITVARAKCAAYGSQVAVFFYASGGSSIYHYASSDLGITFDFVGTSGSASFSSASSLTCCACPRGIVVAYDDATGTSIKILPNAYTEWASISALTVTTTATVSGIGVAADWDGVLYVWETDPAGAGEVSESRDYGQTWTVHSAYASGDASIRPSNTSLVAWHGRLTVIGQHTSAGSYDGSVSEWRLSSWSSLEWDDDPLISWFPAEVPTGSASWTQPGATAGTISATGYLNINTAASTGYYRYDAAAHSFTATAHFVMKLTSGGSAATNDVIASVIATSAGATYHMRLRFITTGFRVRDQVGSSTVVDVTVDTTTDIEILMGFDAAASGFLWYKRPEDTTWTEVPEVAAHTFSDGGALEANWSFWMGHVASTTSESNWRMAVLYDADIGLVDDTSMTGKRITGSPYPLATVDDADGKVGYLSGKGGLALRGESYTIAPGYLYPLSNIFPALSPSPTRTWRSTDLTEHIIAFDYELISNPGTALGLFLAGVNFRTAYLEHYDGANWQTTGTWDGAQGFNGSSIEYDRTGEVLRPTTTTDTVDRYLQGSELVGGTALLDATTAHKILRNTDGWWQASGTTARSPRIYIDDHSSAAAAGDAIFCSPAGLLVVYLTTEQHRQRWRLRIPAQLCPDAYFEIGTMLIGEVMALGQQWGWGASSERVGTYEAETDRHGTEYRTQVGGTRESWFLDWSGGVPEREVRQTAAGDYLGISGGLALAAKGSTRYQIRDLIERTEGQTLPVVAVAQMPSSTTTVTDPTVILYGYPSGSAAWAQANGTEGTDEVMRGETFEVRGIPLRGTD